MLRSLHIFAVLLVRICSKKGHQSKAWGSTVHSQDFSPSGNINGSSWEQRSDSTTATSDLFLHMALNAGVLQRGICTRSTFQEDIYWPEKISNEDLSGQTMSQSVVLEIRHQHWRWLRDVLRMDHNHIRKVALRWTGIGKCKQGWPKQPGGHKVEVKGRWPSHSPGCDKWSVGDRVAQGRTKCRKITDMLSAFQNEKD